MKPEGDFWTIEELIERGWSEVWEMDPRIEEGGQETDVWAVVPHNG
jgi:hypothetical protein